MFKFIEISELIIVNGWSCLRSYTIQRHLSACVWDCNSLHLLRYALSNSNRNFQKSQVTCWSKAGLEVVIWGDIAGEDHQEETEVVPLNHALLFIFVRHWNKVCCVVSGLLQIFYTPFSLRYEPFRATHEREFSCPLNFNFHIAGGLQLHFVSVYQLVRRIQVKIGFLLRPFESDPAISNGGIGGS